MKITTIGLDIAKSVFRCMAPIALAKPCRKKLQRGEVLAFFARRRPAWSAWRRAATAHHWARRTARWATRCG